MTRLCRGYGERAEPEFSTPSTAWRRRIALPAREERAQYLPEPARAVNLLPGAWAHLLDVQHACQFRPIHLLAYGGADPVFQRVGARRYREGRGRIVETAGSASS